MKTISELKAWLSGKECEKVFSRLYGESNIVSQRKRYESLISCFCSYAPELEEAALFSAPGRSEIGGNHTDHQGGCVLGAAVDLDNIAIAAPNGLDRVIIISLDPQDHNVVEVELDRLVPDEAERETGTGMARGVLAEMKNAGYDIGGFTMVNDSAIPGGSGLSSSACFENLIATICDTLFNKGKMPTLEKAKIGQKAENLYFFKSCGLLDQASSCYGGLVSMDFSRKDDPVLGKLDFDFEKRGYALCVIKYGDHSSLSGDYSNIPGNMCSIADFFGAKRLCDVDPEEFTAKLPELREKYNDLSVFRAIHYFDETKRALSMADTLRTDDLDGFFALVNASGRSSELLLRNIEADLGADKQDYSFALGLAMHLLNGKGACRVHGGGFGGTIQAYVPLEEYDDFVSKVNAILSPDGMNVCFRLSVRNDGGIVLVQ